MIPADRSALLVRYSIPAMLLHWIIAAALAFQFAIGFGLEDLGAKAFAQYQLHKSVGITILLLTILRLGVRLFIPRPPALESGLSGKLATFVHAGLYGFMIGAPLTGWMLVSTAKVKVPTLLFGVVPLPHLPIADRWGDLTSGSHEVFAFAGIALFALHIAGALRHQFLLRDGLVYRMTPGKSWAIAVLLSLLLPIAWFAGRAMLPPPAQTAPASQTVAPAPVRTSNVVENSAVAPTEPSVTQTETTAEEAAPVVAAPASLPGWSILPGGTLNFTARYGADSYRGNFARWSGKILFDPEQPAKADIRIEIDMASVSMNDATQDSMIVGSDFFDVPSYAKAVFRAASARKTGKDNYAADGTLTLKGKSAPLGLQFSLKGSSIRRHVTGTATVDRTYFGIGTGSDTAGIAPNVTVTFAFDAEKQAQ